jgi:hypothetical protein
LRQDSRYTARVTRLGRIFAFSAFLIV